jgi:hypothetical protein
MNRPAENQSMRIVCSIAALLLTISFPGISQESEQEYDPQAGARPLRRAPSNVRTQGRVNIIELRPENSSRLYLVLYPRHFELWRDGRVISEQPHPFEGINTYRIDPTLRWVDPKTRKVPLVLGYEDGAIYVFTFPRGWNAKPSLQEFRRSATSLSATDVYFEEKPDADGYVYFESVSSEKDDTVEPPRTYYRWNGTRFVERPGATAK